MIIDTALGRLIAQRVARATDGANVLQILGIPYARAERFRPPVPVGASDGGAPAGAPVNTGYGTCFPQRLAPRAVNLALRHFQLRPEWQPRGDVAGEDSLRVNVWTPMGGAPRPVLVFIHGGDCGSGRCRSTTARTWPGGASSSSPSPTASGRSGTCTSSTAGR